MIEAFIEQARRQGMIELNRPYCWNLQIRLFRLSVDVFGPGGEFHHLRIAESVDLADELLVHEKVHLQYREMAPRARGLLRIGSATCIVFDGVRSRPVTGRQLLRAGSGNALTDELIRYFKMQRTSTEGDGAGQHGDFVVENLGMMRERLVVFDWEDFGKVVEPGFDLSTLLWSATGFDPATLRRLVADRTRVWIDEACTTVGLDRESLLRRLPRHLNLFLKLKANYSAVIRRRVSAAMAGIGDSW